MEQPLDNSPSYNQLASECCFLSITLESIRKLSNGTQPTIAQQAIPTTALREIAAKIKHVVSLLEGGIANEGGDCQFDGKEDIVRDLTECSRQLLVLP